MDGPQTAAQFTLNLRRTFQAPREKVFAAWTEEEALKQWWGPEGVTCETAECDLRPGGRYRITARTAEGQKVGVEGAFQVYEPPEKVSYTWRFDHWEKGVPDTLVTVEFLDKGGSTEIVLTHERFADAETRDHHNQGWGSCFDCLAKFLAA